jgi:hypothetical protein
VGGWAQRASLLARADEVIEGAEPGRFRDPRLPYARPVTRLRRPTGFRDRVRIGMTAGRGAPGGAQP